MKQASKSAKVDKSNASDGQGRERNSSPSTELWELRLYVAGQSPKSLAAVTNLKQLCETHLEGKYRIQVIDLLQNPQLAAGDQIVAIPTLVRRLPEPMRKIIGDLSNTERVLMACNSVQERSSVRDWKGLGVSGGIDESCQVGHQWGKSVTCP